MMSHFKMIRAATAYLKSDLAFLTICLIKSTQHKLQDCYRTSDLSSFETVRLVLISHVVANLIVSLSSVQTGLTTGLNLVIRLKCQMHLVLYFQLKQLLILHLLHVS